MAWLTTNDDERNAITQLDKDSDRAAGIVAATIVETRLEQAIKSRLHPHDDIHRELFHPSGPLGSFAMKINLAFVMGIVSSGAFSDLKTIKNIRNRFAHHLDISSFESPSIRDQCMSLNWFERFIAKDVPDFKDVSVESVRQITQGLTMGRFGGFAIGHGDVAEQLKKPRERYLWCAQVLNIVLGHRHEHHPPTPDFG